MGPPSFLWDTEPLVPAQERVTAPWCQAGMWCQASSVSRLPLELALVPRAGVPLCCEAPTQLTFVTQKSWLMRPDSGYISTLTATHLLKVFALGRDRDMKVFAKPGFLGGPFIY